jgi:hypothetical protein
MSGSSVLAVGLLFGLRRPDRRPYLFGFTLFGAMALVFIVNLMVFFREATVVAYVSLFRGPVWSIIGPDRPVVWIPAAYSVAVGVLTLPQVAFALLGGFLFRKFPRKSGHALVTSIDGPRVASIGPPAYDRIKIDSLILLVLSSGTGGQWVENPGSTGGRRCSPPSLSC